MDSSSWPAPRESRVKNHTLAHSQLQGRAVTGRDGDTGGERPTPAVPSPPHPPPYQGASSDGTLSCGRPSTCATRSSSPRCPGQGTESWRSSGTGLRNTRPPPHAAGSSGTADVRMGTHDDGSGGTGRGGAAGATHRSNSAPRKTSRRRRTCGCVACGGTARVPQARGGTRSTAATNAGTEGGWGSATGRGSARAVAHSPCNGLWVAVTIREDLWLFTMRIAVLGAGVIGLSSAVALAQGDAPADLQCGTTWHAVPHSPPARTSPAPCSRVW